MTAELDRLIAGKYLLLTTFRKDGTAVPTPVWFAEDGSDLVVWTVTDSGKAKRVRRDGAVTIAACDIRGNATGAPIRAHARILDSAGTQRVRELIAKRYGLIGHITMLGSRIRRGADGTIGLAITPTPDADAD